MTFNNTTLLSDIDIPYVFCECLIALVTVIGNSLVIVVFMLYANLRTVTNYYVISLASADMLVGLMGVPFAILTSVGLPGNFEACLFMNSLLVGLCTSSIFSLVALSIDRYLAILHPLRYESTMTARNSVFVITVSWILATIIGLFPLFGWNVGRPPVARCFFTEVMDLTYLVFIFMATILIPSGFIAMVYGRIYWVIRAHLRQMALYNAAGGLDAAGTTISGSSKPLYSKTEANAAKGLAVIVLLFVISWTPLYTINTIMCFCEECHVNIHIINFTIVLSHINSMWNPGLYAWGLADFRASLKKLIFYKRYGRPSFPEGCRRYSENGASKGYSRNYSIAMQDGYGRDCPRMNRLK